MKLINLKIKGFKNLTGSDGWFEIDFENKNGITVLVGNNGSGKSNVLEAISAIFGWFYNQLREPGFDFKIQYVIDRKRIEIDYHNDSGFYRSTIDGIDGKDPLSLGFIPSRLIANYSGEEDRLFKNYFEHFEKWYKKQIKGTTKSTFQNNFFFIDKRDWEKAILTLIIYNFDFLKSIGVNGIKDIKIEFDINKLSKYDKDPNPTTAFIEKINNLKSGNKTFSLDDLKNIIFDYITDENGNILIDENGNNLIADEEYTKKEFYEQLWLSEQFGFIKNIEVDFSDEQDIFSLSEGEKKQILIYFILNIIANKDSIILLDEPDSYIHVGNKERLKKTFEKFRKDYGEGEIILTTHSPTLMSLFDDDNLEFLDDGEIKTKEKQEILNSITDDTMSFSDKLEILTTTKDILLVEGKTDEKYISKALEVLKEDNEEYKDLDFEFIVMGGTDGEHWKNILDKIKLKKDQKIIGLLDRDDAGKKCLKFILGEDINLSSFDCKEYNKKFLCLYPKKINFTKTHFEVEDYFPIEKLTKFTFNDIETFENLKQRFNKNDFAEKCKDFDKKDFEGFKVLFDKILEIKNKF